MRGNKAFLSTWVYCAIGVSKKLPMRISTFRRSLHAPRRQRVGVSASAPQPEGITVFIDRAATDELAVGAIAIVMVEKVYRCRCSSGPPSLATSRSRKPSLSQSPQEQTAEFATSVAMLPALSMPRSITTLKVPYSPRPGVTLQEVE